MNNKLTPAQLIIVIAGAVALIASFLDWYSVGSFGGNAWSDELYFPTYAWVGIFGLIMALAVALPAFANVKLPPDLLGFSWPQVHLALAVFTLILTISWLIGGEEQAIGFWLSLLASIALVVGAVMLQREPATGTTRSTGDIPPPPPPA